MDVILLAALFAHAPSGGAFDAGRRAVAELSADSPRRVRLSRPFVRFDPRSGQRTLIEDWSGDEEARAVEADVRALLLRFAKPETRALFSTTPIYMARLSGASGHTAEEPGDPRRFVVYLDPYRATGRLHAASTLVHEFTHVERYQKRGSHANRAATVLSKADFINLGAGDELEAYQAEAAFLRSFLDALPSEAERETVRKTMLRRQFRWPVALTTLLGLEGPSDPAKRMAEVRAQIMLDLERPAARYWEIHQPRNSPPESAP